jgi:hypothetical protein
MNAAGSRSGIAALPLIYSGAAVVAALVLGFAVYRVMHPVTASPILTAAALDHEEEIVDGQSRGWETDRVSIAGLAKRQGLPAAAIINFAHEGFHLEQGRLGQIAGLSCLHLIYSNGKQRFSLFLQQPAPPDDQKSAGHDSIDTANIGADHVAAFRYEKLIGIVVTDQPGDAASHLARFAAATFEKP